MAHEAVCVIDVLTTFDVFCDLLLKECKAACNLFYEKNINKEKKALMMS